MLASSINLSLSLDTLMFVLVLAGIVVLLVLAKLLFSVSKITGTISKSLEENKSSLDATIKDLPTITSNLSRIIADADDLVIDIKPSIAGALKDVNTVTSQISNVTTNISDTVEVVGLAAADTASRFTTSVNNATDYFALAKGLLKHFGKSKK